MIYFKQIFLRPLKMRAFFWSFFGNCIQQMLFVNKNLIDLNILIWYYRYVI